MKRTSLSPSGRKDGYMTTFHIPKRLNDELKTVCSPKGRTRWVLSALAAFHKFDEVERNIMLKADLRGRVEKMISLPVRLPIGSQNQLREMLISFRRASPEWDLDNTGIVRSAIIFYLRYHEGRFVAPSLC